MSDGTAIEWADASWNPIRGVRDRWYCERISPGCDYCYASRLNVRFGGQPYPRVGEGQTDPIQLNLDALREPLHWRKPRRIFVCSMTDLFGEWVSDYQIESVFGVMALCQQHTFLILTKRPQRMRRWFEETGDLEDREMAVARAAGHLGEVIWDARGNVREHYLDCCGGPPDAANLQKRRVWPGWPLPNVWLGTSLELDRYRWRIGELLQTPAAVHWVSAEPLLGPLDFCVPASLPHRVEPGVYNTLTGEWWPAVGDAAIEHATREIDLPRLGWVVAGGESGGPEDRRLMERCGIGLYDVCSECDDTGWRPKPEALDWARSLRDQCRNAGVPFLWKQWPIPPTRPGGPALLDGKEWRAFPVVRRS